VPPVIPTRPALLAARVGDLLAWHLVVRCPCRGYPRSIPLADIAAEHGRRLTLGQVAARLRCARCGEPPQSVRASPGDPFASRAWKVILK